MTLGERIKELRSKKGLTQEELGKLIGISGVAIMRYEKGQREPDIKTIEKLALKLGVSPLQLMGWEFSEVLDIEVNSIQGVIAVIKEIYGTVELVEDVLAEKSYSYWLIGTPPNQFVLHEKDMDTIYEMTKSAIPPIVERMKDIRCIDDIVNDLISK